MGEHAGCDMGGPLVVGHRPLGPPAPGILLGELDRNAIRVLGVKQFQGLGDAPVQQPAFRRADPRICRFAQQVMGEVVAIPEFPHDPAPPQLVNCLHNQVGVQVRCLSEQIEGEIRAGRAAISATSRAAAVPCSRRLRSTVVRSPAGSSVPPAAAVPRSASMTCSGKPPVAACSRSASASGKRCPDTASARCAVSAASSGLRETSVSNPAARIRTIQPASSASWSRESSRTVAATRSCASSASPRQNVMNASVS